MTGTSRPYQRYSLVFENLRSSWGPAPNLHLSLGWGLAFSSHCCSTRLVLDRSAGELSALLLSLKKETALLHGEASKKSF
jgi:hypothetical protein